MMRPMIPRSHGPRAVRWQVAGAIALALFMSGLPVAPAALGQPDASSAPALDEERIDEALRILAEHFVDRDALDAEALTEGAIRGITDALGDEGHTEFLTAEEYAAEREVLDGRVLGIGVLLDERSRDHEVIGVVDGSPADRAGLRSGDIIVSIDGQETSRLRLDDLAAMVRGAPGTSISIGVERPGEPSRLQFDIVRDSVAIDPASWARVPGSDVAVVRIVQFSTGAAARVREVVEAALADGTGGIVLDLRGNPGGLVAEALDVAAAFRDGGVAYQEVSRDGVVRKVRIPAGRTVAAEVPIVVLVDFGTASSAEILAAGLRDNDRAVLVGEPTFGTGTIVNTFALSDGSALNVGVSAWRTPAGLDVSREGLVPDYEVESVVGASPLRPADLADLSPQAFASSDDLALRRAVGLLEPLAAS